MKKPSTWHLRILYLLLLILICISIAPLWFYGTKILSTNQETLKTKEQELQTVTSQSLAQEISLYEENVRGHLADFFASVTAPSRILPANNPPCCLPRSSTTRPRACRRASITPPAMLS